MKNFLKIQLFFICFGFLCVCTSCAFKEPKTIISPPSELMVKEKKEERVLLLPEYEKLTYDLRWLGIKAGTITATIEGIKQYKGRDVYVFTIVVRSNGWLSAIYNIESIYISYTDVEHMHSLYEEVNRKEGRYRKHAIVEYDQDNHVAHFESFTDGSKKSFDIPPNAQDGLGAVYYFRTLPLNVGDKTTYPIILGESIYDFHADVLDRQTIRVGRYGKQDAIKVHPYGYHKSKKVREGTMIGYFSPGKVKIPLYSKIKTPLFTSATATLSDIQYIKE